MKRLLALLVALGILVLTAPGLVAYQAGDEKKKDDKKEEKKEEKKKEEEKLTDAQKDELKKLSGTFTVTSFERDGKKSTAEELKKMKVIQKGAEWSFHVGDEITTGKDTPYPDKTPNKEINSTYTNGPAVNKVVKGIYKIEGDSITYCWGDVDKDRPSDYSTKADSGQTLMVLKRMSEGKKDDEKKEEKKEEKKDPR